MSIHVSHNIRIRPNPTVYVVIDLRPLTKHLIKTHQRQPKPNIIILVDTLNRLLASLLANINSLHPALNILLTRQLQHLLHLRPVSNMAGTHVASIRRKCLRVERLQLVVGKADHVERAVDLEGGEVVWEVEFVGCVCAVEDDVELEGPWLEPLVFVAGDEVFGAELEGVVLL